MRLVFSTIDMKLNDSNRDEVGEFDMSVSNDVCKLNPRKRKQKKSASPPVLSYVGFASDFGFSIALPLGGALIVGRYLDERFGSSPKATIVALIVGFVISMTTFFRVIRDVIKNSQAKK